MLLCIKRHLEVWEDSAKTRCIVVCCFGFFFPYYNALCLQAVALARKSMPADMEAEISKCNIRKAIQAVAETNKGFCEASLNSTLRFCL